VQADAPPGFDIQSMAGFRLIRPTATAAGDEMKVSVELCRVIGWAASSPRLVHFERQGQNGAPDEHHDVFVDRLGLRAGENCQRITTRFASSPMSSEKIKICLAYSHRRCE
jgi:hypothetical protein